ncbi:MAG: hypothetical protein AMXMBFR83_20670 [Phycisphaerae bacterium]
MGRTWRLRGVGVLVCAASVRAATVPGSAESIGLTRIVPDTVVADNSNLQALGNWEPFSSVVGNSVFLIQGVTYAEGWANPLRCGFTPTTHVNCGRQRYVVMFQKVTGGPPVLGEGFFADDGTPYKGPINGSRQNGNPGRVAGDMRPGATNFIVGGEASPHLFPAFQSDNRWNLGLIRQTPDPPTENVDRYCAAQVHSLDPDTLAQTSLCKAFDAVLGRLTSGTSAVHPEVGRFGGDVAGLSDGNFVVVADDRSNLFNTTRSATAVIVRPDGTLVKDSFVIGAGELWSNVAAYQGGFCVRLGGVFKFYDNAGNFQGEVSQNAQPILDAYLAGSGSLDSGRGDGHRIGAHINSPFVFHATKVDVAQAVIVAAWDARTRSLAGFATVNEADLWPSPDRINVAVDALNRVIVVYDTANGVGTYTGRPAVVARVLHFNERTGAFTHLTPSFLPFQNAHNAPTSVTCNNANISADATALTSPPYNVRTFRASPAMTTRQICVAAKGEISTANPPNECGDTGVEVNFYTVLSHPDPKDDPTFSCPDAAPWPTVSAIAPAHGTANRTVKNVKITGSNLVDGDTYVILRAGGTADIVLSPNQVSVADDKSSATFDLDLTGAALGPYDVLVSTPCAPMARLAGAFTVVECIDPFADMDEDGDVDHADYGAWQACYTGAVEGGPLSPACKCFDRDLNGARDDKIDAADLESFLKCFSGPAVPADKDCDGA